VDSRKPVRRAGNSTCGHEKASQRPVRGLPGSLLGRFGLQGVSSTADTMSLGVALARTELIPRQLTIDGTAARAGSDGGGPSLLYVTDALALEDADHD
jgi:hypothetical protein